MARVMNVVFGIGIAVLIFVVVLLGIRAFYPAPNLESYNCTYPQYTVPKICDPNMTVQQCNDYQYKDQNYTAQQNQYDQCFKNYESAQKVYNRNLFFIAFIIGIICVVISMFLLDMTNISAGVAFAGLVLIIYGFIRGWETTNDILKFITGLVAAGVVITFAVILNKRYSKNSD